MTNTTVQAAAIVLSALVTAGTLFSANAMAAQQYAAADKVATAQMPLLAMQSVVVVGHRIAKA